MILPFRVLGIGVASNACIDDVESLLLHNEVKDLNAIATLLGKENHPVICYLRDRLCVSVMTFHSSQLEELTPRLKNPSQHIFNAIGCHSVAEASAIAACGEKAKLVLEKTVYGNVTIAIAEVNLT